MVASFLASLLRSQTKVPSNDNCEKPFGTENCIIFCGLVGFWLGGILDTSLRNGLRL